MTNSLPLPVRDAESGFPMLVAGYIGAFFLPPAIHEHVGPLTQAMEKYLVLPPPGTLRWQAIGAGAEDWRAVGAATRAKCLDQLRPEAARKRDLTSIELRSGSDEQEASQWSIVIIGNPPDKEMPDETSLFEMTMPANSFDVEEAESAARIFMAFAQDLPYRYAYFSPALLWSPVLEDQALSSARKIAMKFPGLDVSRNAVARSFIGRGVRGARWITLLDATLAETAGGIQELKAASHGTFDAVPFKGGVALRAGPAPNVRADGGPSFEAMRALARALECMTVQDEAALTATEFSPDDDEDFVSKWERRYLK